MLKAYPEEAVSPAWGEEEKGAHDNEAQGIEEDDTLTEDITATVTYLEAEIVPKQKVKCYDIYEVHIFLDDEFSFLNPNHITIIRDLFAYQGLYKEYALYETRPLVEIRSRKQLVAYFVTAYSADRTAMTVKDRKGVFAYNVKKIAYDN